MNRIRIQDDKSCKYNVDIRVGTYPCVEICPLFIKKVNNKIHCNGDEYIIEMDLNGNIYKLKK